MGDKQNIFQIAILGIFAALAIIGLFFFATLKGDDQSVFISEISIWGTYPETEMRQAISTIHSSVGGLEKVTYRQVAPERIYSELIEYLAAGGGPDLVFMDDDRLVPFLNKVYSINYEQYSERLFRDTFIEGGEVFAFPNGIYALPVTVDPLVLYWNRSIFSSAGITQVPKTWEEVVSLAPRLSSIVDGATLVRGAIPLGLYDNVSNAKDILSALMMQAGTNIVYHDKGLRSGLIRNTEGVRPTEAALRFFTDFSNPKKSVYSWNLSFERSREAFMAGRVAMYIGFASEAETMRKINPNLNFDVAVLPQSRSRTYPTTYGHFQGLAIMRSSGSPARAFAVAQILTSAQGIATLQQITKLPPVRRDLLARKPIDPAGVVAYESAIIARSWLEPDAELVNGMFSRMIGAIVSGRSSVTEAVSVTDRELDSVLPRE